MTLAFCAVVAVIAVAVTVALHSLIASARQERVQAQLAMLGRWKLVLPLVPGVSLGLDFHTGETGRCDFTAPGVRGSAPISYTIRQVTRRQRILDALQHRKPPSATYFFQIGRLSSALPQLKLGAARAGVLLGDGNTLALSDPPLPPLVLRRVGSG